MNHLAGREILLGVTGGIAGYKAVQVLRLLKKAGAEVSVVMTESAGEFVRPLTFQTLSGRPVGTRLFDLSRESSISHIQLAQRADLVLVAPCTANLAAKLRAGLADDLLSTVLLATTAPVYLALAMNEHMLDHPATRENIEVLKARGVHIIAPETGFLAEFQHQEQEAPGRLAEPERIVERVESHFARKAQGQTVELSTGATSGNILQGRKVLITAGPTVENIDPVRFITNRSSGRMGYALAQACLDAGAEVLLVAGPVHLPTPERVTLSRVKSAEEMRAVVMENQAAQDALIFAAAVSDYRVAHPSKQKIKRQGQPTLSLELEENPDIAAQAGARKRPGQISVVFAAESQHLLANAQKKLSSKNADLVVANDITEPGSGFDSQKNRVTLLRRGIPGMQDLEPERLPLLDKSLVAQHIVQTMGELLAKGP